MSYEEIYMMKPIKEVEPGWWKLRWRAIKSTPDRGGTWNLYSEKWYTTWKNCCFGFRFNTTGGAHNGWHRSYDRIDLTLYFAKWTLSFWIKYNYVVHESGPSDVAEDQKKPLNFSIEE